MVLPTGRSVDGGLLAGVTRALGLVMTAVLGLVMLLRSPRIGAIRATGIMFVAYVLLGPVIWPWYLPAGFALLALSWGQPYAFEVRWTITTIVLLFWIGSAVAAYRMVVREVLLADLVELGVVARLHLHETIIGSG